MLSFTAFVQTRLTIHGFPLTVDGICGPRTRTAIREFQREHGIPMTGVVTPGTVNALRAQPKPGSKQIDVTKPQVAAPDAVLPPWIETGLRYLGTAEAPGDANNETIMGFAEIADIDYDGDDVPWCGLYTAAVMAQTTDDGIPTRPLAARNWLSFGYEIQYYRPGAIVVLWRGKRNGWQGHVGFAVGENDTHVFVLGGNQDNAVSICPLPKTRVLGYRWPGSVSAALYPTDWRLLASGAVERVLPKSETAETADVAEPDLA